MGIAFRTLIQGVTRHLVIQEGNRSDRYVHSKKQNNVEIKMARVLNQPSTSVKLPRAGFSPIVVGEDSANCLMNNCNDSLISVSLPIPENGPEELDALSKN